MEGTGHAAPQVLVASSKHRRGVLGRAVRPMRGGELARRKEVRDAAADDDVRPQARAAVGEASLNL